MLEVDEEFEINCDKCKSQYNFTVLMPENRLAYELFSDMNSPFVGIFNKLQTVIWEKYKNRIEEHGFFRLLNKLNVIAKIVKEFSNPEMETKKRK